MWRYHANRMDGLQGGQKSEATFLLLTSLKHLNQK